MYIMLPINISQLYDNNFKGTKVNYFLNILNLFQQLSYEIPEAPIYIKNSQQKDTQLIYGNLE